MPKNNEQGQRPYRPDPWAQFMFGGPGPQGNAPNGAAKGNQQNQYNPNQQSNNTSQTKSESQPQLGDTMNSILGPFMNENGNLDMKKVSSGMNSAMKMANQFGPAVKKLGPLLEMFTKSK